MRHPAAYAGVAYNLSQGYHRACARLRTVDLVGTAPVKLARLLWEWSAGGQKSGRGASLHMPFTHGEIGGLKVLAKSGWFAARPSGTEEIYKIYAESFQGPDHLRRILDEAQRIVNDALTTSNPAEGS